MMSSTRRVTQIMGEAEVKPSSIIIEWKKSFDSTQKPIREFAEALEAYVSTSKRTYVGWGGVAALVVCFAYLLNSGEQQRDSKILLIVAFLAAPVFCFYLMSHGDEKKEKAGGFIRENYKAMVDLTEKFAIPCVKLLEDIPILNFLKINPKVGPLLLRDFKALDTEIAKYLKDLQKLKLILEECTLSQPLSDLVLDYYFNPETLCAFFPLKKRHPDVYKNPKRQSSLYLENFDKTPETKLSK